MENTLAIFLAWGAFLVDGNHLTNLVSIGHKTARTGHFPPPPAIVGGLNTHGVFEGECKHLRTFRGDTHLIWIKVTQVPPAGINTLETTILSMKPSFSRYLIFPKTRSRMISYPLHDL